jgi:DNA polymerase-3 subunit epsilon
LDQSGQPDQAWTTLVNPCRDLGPQDLHGVTSREILDAPTFGQIAGVIAELLQGRVFVAHNVRFDLGFVVHEFSRAGWDVPLTIDAALCTQALSREMAGPARLSEACKAFGVPLASAHHAFDDAVAAVGIFQVALGLRLNDAKVKLSGHLPWDAQLCAASAAQWPDIPREPVEGVRRCGDGREVEDLNLGGIARKVPPRSRRVGQSAVSTYLEAIDGVLIDRVVSAREHREIEELAAELGIDSHTAEALHQRYLADLATEAMADDVVTDAEREDMERVAQLLGLGPDAVDVALKEFGSARSAPAFAKFALTSGDRVVFTGAMSRERSEWHELAVHAGLVPGGSVTRATKLVIAADPDSLSGKARKAESLGIPIITEDTFAAMLGV